MAWQEPGWSSLELGPSLSLSQTGPNPGSCQPGLEPCLAHGLGAPRAAWFPVLGLSSPRPARQLVRAAQTLLVLSPGPLVGLACGC